MHATHLNSWPHKVQLTGGPFSVVLGSSRSSGRKPSNHILRVSLSPAYARQRAPGPSPRPHRYTVSRAPSSVEKDLTCSTKSITACTAESVHWYLSACVNRPRTMVFSPFRASKYAGLRLESEEPPESERSGNCESWASWADRSSWGEWGASFPFRRGYSRAGVLMCGRIHVHVSGRDLRIEGEFQGSHQDFNAS